MKDNPLSFRLIIFLYRLKVSLLDLLVRFDFMSPLVNCAVIFKSNSKLKDLMKFQGWRFSILPR